MLLLIVLTPFKSAKSQVHVDVEKKVENEANYRANKNTDQLIDKGFDEIENGIKGLFKKKKKKGKENKVDNQNDNKKSSVDNSSQEAEQQTEKSEPRTPKVVWAKYDFVPGDKVIFEDGPSPDEENGEFPSRWDLYSGNAEIGEVDGETVILFLSRSTFIIPYLKNSKEDYLPDVFTLEMDVWFSKSSSTSNRVWVYLGDKKKSEI